MCSHTFAHSRHLCIQMEQYMLHTLCDSVFTYAFPCAHTCESGHACCLAEIRRDVSVPGPTRWLCWLGGEVLPPSWRLISLQEVLMPVTHSPEEFRAARWWKVSRIRGFRVSFSFCHNYWCFCATLGRLPSLSRSSGSLSTCCACHSPACC